MREGRDLEFQRESASGLELGGGVAISAARIRVSSVAAERSPGTGMGMGWVGRG